MIARPEWLGVPRPAGAGADGDAPPGPEGSCAWVQRHVTEYAAREASPEVARIVAAHVPTCAPCRVVLDETAEMLELLRPAFRALRSSS